MKNKEWCPRWVFRRYFSPCGILLAMKCLGRFMAGLILADPIFDYPPCRILSAVSPLTNLASARTLSIKISLPLPLPLPSQSPTCFLLSMILFRMHFVACLDLPPFIRLRKKQQRSLNPRHKAPWKWGRTPSEQDRIRATVPPRVLSLPRRRHENHATIAPRAPSARVEPGIDHPLLGNRTGRSFV